MANKLELIWVGKDKNPQIELCILLHDESKDYGDPNTGNMLIHRDNLMALKALEQEFSGKVKCIYIDPPYNTDVTNEHYDDYVEHSVWLEKMYSQLQILKNLLSDDGMIFIQIDDEEQAYLKIICDEIFGRNNYLNTISVKTKASSGVSGGGEDKRLKKNYEFILVYVSNYDKVSYTPPIEKVKLSDYIKEHKDSSTGFYYTRVITDYGEREYIGTTQAGNGEDIKIYRHSNYKFSSISKIAKEQNITEEEAYSKYFSNVFMVTNAQTSILTRVNEYVGKKKELISYEYVPSTGRSKGKLTTKYVWNQTLVTWLRDSAVLEDGIVYKLQNMGTLWTDISWGRLDLEGGVSFKSGKKPERLIERIIEMSTKPGDLVLDSFLGSGTTAAVAQKMGRQWIGVELGDHCYTHCKYRLDKVINGEQGGISKDLDWQGGGGYKFYELTPAPDC